MTYELGDTRDCVITRIAASVVFRNELEVGTLLVPIYVRKTGPQPEIEVRGVLTIEPAIKGVLLRDWLANLPHLVARLLARCNTPPNDLLATVGIGAKVDIHERGVSPRRGERRTPAGTLAERKTRDQLHL